MRHTFRAALLLCAFLLAGPSAGAGSAPTGFEPQGTNAVEPVTAGGETTFHIEEGQCSSKLYDNGSGESDCENGNTRSNISSMRLTRLGQTIDYSFDVWVDPAFKYEGTYYTGAEALPYRPGGWDSNLRIASWEGPMRKSFVYMLKLDATKGLTFMGKECAPPSSFGQWVSFRLQIRWENTNKGWVKASCDDRVVYSLEGVPTNKQTQCYVQNECIPGSKLDPKQFNFVLGMLYSGNGPDFAETGFDSRFNHLQPGGLTIKMRNVSQKEGGELYGPNEKAAIKTLQEALNALGCPVGTPDGAMGKKTRQAALTCRAFADGALPYELNVGNVARFAELYTAEGVMDLPTGKAPQPPEFVLHVASGTYDKSTENDVYYTMSSYIERPGTELAPFDFVIIGDRFDAASGRFGILELKLEDGISEKAADQLAKCTGNRVETQPDGTRHAVLGLLHKGNAYLARNFDCVLAALPKPLAANAAVLVDHFRDFATTLVNEKSLSRFTNEKVLALVEQVAKGDVEFGRGNSSMPRYVIHMHEKKALRSLTQVQSILEGRAEGYPDMSDFEFVLMGKYDSAEMNFTELSFIITDDLPPKADLSACQNAIDTSLDGTPRAAIRFERKGSDLVSTNADCLRKALSGDAKAAVGLFTGYFFEMAAGAEADGTIDKISSTPLQAFLHRVAAGEIVVSRPGS